MKTLTVLEPWAFLIVAGHKRIETRSWATKYRGELAIHAGHAMDEDGEALIEELTRPMGRGRTESAGGAWLAPLKGYGFDRGEMGKVIGVVELVDVVRIDRRLAMALSPKERMLGDYAEGRWAWMLEHPRRLVAPVEARGHLGLWEVRL